MALGGNGSLEAGLGDDLHPLAADSGVGVGQRAELGQVVECLLFAALGRQPSRRVWEEDGTEAEEEARKDLDEEGELPRPVVRDALGSVCDALVRMAHKAECLRVLTGNPE